MDLLAYLVKHSGDLVTKEALYAHVWPDVMISESTLVSCLSEIREALGDSAGEPRFLKTIPRLGYRFICEVDMDGKRMTVDLPEGLVPESDES